MTTRYGFPKENAALGYVPPDAPLPLRRRMLRMRWRCPSWLASILRRAEPAPARDPRDRRVIVCNYAVGTSPVREGARAYLLNPNPGWGGERVEVLVRSRGGRWIRKWEAAKKLTNFRYATLPPEHPLYEDEQLVDQQWGWFDTLAESLNKASQR